MTVCVCLCSWDVHLQSDTINICTNRELLIDGCSQRKKSRPWVWSLPQDRIKVKYCLKWLKQFCICTHSDNLTKHVLLFHQIPEKFFFKRPNILCHMCIFYVLQFIIDCKVSYQAPRVILFGRCPFRLSKHPAHVGERAKGKEGTAATFQIPIHSNWCRRRAIAAFRKSR